MYIFFNQKYFSAAESGNVGVVYLIESQADIDRIEKDEPGHAPYIPIFYVGDGQNLQNLKNLLRLKNSGKINGFIFIYDNRTISKGYSDDYGCPNAFSSKYLINNLYFFRNFSLKIFFRSDFIFESKNIYKLLVLKVKNKF